MIKILYVPSLNTPVSYWRIEAYADQLVRFKKKCAVNVEYFDQILTENQAWDNACVGHGQISKDIQTKMDNAFKFFDVIIFQRIQNKAALALIEELRKKYPKVKTVAEIDDCVGEVALSSPHHWTDQHRWTVEHLFRSDAVICSTEYLANSIKPIIGDKPVHIAPNCINKNIWKFKKTNKDKNENELRVGYVGGGSHDDDLRIAYTAMLPILKANKNSNIKFIIRLGGYRPNWLKDHPQIDFKSVGWHISNYPQKLYDMNLDLALAPLRDSEFNRCKSNLKWIEWASLGVPLLASNVEPYKKTNGTITLVNNSEWICSLQNAIALIDHPGFLGKSNYLRSQCLENYNIKKESLKVLKFFEKLLLLE